MFSKKEESHTPTRLLSLVWLLTFKFFVVITAKYLGYCFEYMAQKTIRTHDRLLRPTYLGFSLSKKETTSTD